MTIQHSHHRHTPAKRTPAPALFDPEPLTNHSRAFHTELRKLRSALYANHPHRIQEIELRLDQIVARWERESEN